MFLERKMEKIWSIPIYKLVMWLICLSAVAGGMASSSVATGVSIWAALVALGLVITTVTDGFDLMSSGMGNNPEPRAAHSDEEE